MPRELEERMVKLLREMLDWEPPWGYAAKIRALLEEYDETLDKNLST